MFTLVWLMLYETEFISYIICTVCTFTFYLSLFVCYYVEVMRCVRYSNTLKELNWIRHFSCGSFEADMYDRQSRSVGHHSTLVLKVPKVNLLTSQPAVRNKFTQSLIFFFSKVFAFLIIASSPSLPKPIERSICSANTPISAFLLFSFDIFGPTDDTFITSDIVLNSWRRFLTIKEARNTSNWVALTCNKIWGENITGTPPTDLSKDDDCCHPISE